MTCLALDVCRRAFLSVLTTPAMKAEQCFACCDLGFRVGNFPGGANGRIVWRAILGEAK
jgi:hypothetical protein